MVKKVMARASARGGRRNHSDAFKAKVALAALRNDRTMAQICAQFEVHATQVNLWKEQLLGNASLAFTKGAVGHTETDVTPLHAKIGQLTLENDFLEHALTKAGLLSVKRCLTRSTNCPSPRKPNY